MKRYSILALAMVLGCTLFTGCNRREPMPGATSSATHTTQPSTHATAPATTPTMPMTTEATTVPMTTEPTTGHATEPSTSSATAPASRARVQDPGMR